MYGNQIWQKLKFHFCQTWLLINTDFGDFIANLVTILVLLSDSIGSFLPTKPLVCASTILYVHSWLQQVHCSSKIMWL